MFQRQEGTENQNEFYPELIKHQSQEAPITTAASDSQSFFYIWFS